MPDDKRRTDDEAVPAPPAGPSSERDFGDSAGYGSGGSTLDYHEVGDEGGGPKKPNPLDDVVKTPRES